jgi:hypothetical protein
VHHRGAERDAVHTGDFTVLVPGDRLGIGMLGAGEEGLPAGRAELEERTLLLVENLWIPPALGFLRRRLDDVEPVRIASTRASEPAAGRRKEGRRPAQGFKRIEVAVHKPRGRDAKEDANVLGGAIEVLDEPWLIDDAEALPFGQHRLLRAPGDRDGRPASPHIVERNVDGTHAAPLMIARSQAAAALTRAMATPSPPRSG